MSSIDERIVSMKFNNGQFLNGIKGTLDALSSLKKGLNLDSSKKSLQELDQAGKKFSLANVANGIETISGKFVALATIGITALSNITNKAIDTGLALARSLTVDPIKSGLEEYETQLNAVQTILANTESKGTVLADVNGALQELNKYADMTIYNFTEMTRNIGTFTAAGVDLDTSVNAIKGIANLAAVSGSSSQQASTAMYQLSQALATGTVKLMDWNSVVNAGMGGQYFQDALKETARVHGVAVDQIIEEQGSFRDSLAEGWLTSEILTETLSKLTGDLTDQQLEAMGYTQEQIAEIQKMAQTASDAATKVKTATQLIDTLQEAVGSGWAQTWQIVFGDFEEAKELFTGVSDTLSEMINQSADARNKVLGDWKALGGRTALIDAVKNAFDALMGVIKPIKEAFREIFPPVTGEQLAKLSEAIRDFTANLKMSSPMAENLKRTAKGLFAALDIGWQIIKGVIGVLGDLFGEVASGTGGFLEFTAGIGDWLVQLRDAIKSGEGLTKFFDGLSAVVRKPIEMLKEFASWLGTIFGGDELNEGPLNMALENVQKRLEPMQMLVQALSKIWEGFLRLAKEAWEWFQPLGRAIGEFFQNFASGMAGSLEGVNFEQFLDTINTGLLGALVLIIKKFLSNGINVDLGGGFLGSIKDAFDGLTGTMVAMQNQLKANTLMKIAGAIALLTASVVALSFIDSGRLTTALAGLTAMFTQLLAAMAIFEKIAANSAFLKMPFMAASLILLSTAILILTAAVKNLSSLEWEELAKGLTGVTVLLGVLAGAAKLLSANSGGLVTAGAGMILVAAAIKVLASAVSDFAGMSWEEMAQGMAGVAGALTALGLFSKFAALGKVGLANSAGILIISAAMKVLASAVKDFAGMSWEELGRGMAAMGGGLLIIAGAMALMSGTLLGATALIIVAGSLIVIAEALDKMSQLSWEEIGKAMTMLAGSLLLIAGGMYLMTGALPGAAALIVVAGALAILAPVLLALGQMSWEEIGKGLATLAGAFVVLGLAGLVLTPVVPTLLGLGAAITLIGAGLALAGVGVLAFATGLTALAAAGAVGTVAIVGLVSAIIGLIPMAMEALATGIVAFAAVIANSGPTMVAAMTTMMMSLLQSIDKVAPKIIDTLFRLIMKLIDTLAANVPKFVDKGLQMITGILQGIGKNISGIVQAAITIVTNFIDGIAKSLPKVIQSGINLIITFVESLADGIRRNTARMQAAGRDLASAIIEGMTGGIGRGIKSVTDAARNVAKSALNAAKRFLGIASPSKEFTKVGEFSSEGMANGLSSSANMVARAAEGVGDTALSTLKKSMSKLGSTVYMTDMDMEPTIRPVLDLSDVEKKAGKLDGLLTPSAIKAKASYEKAATIQARKQSADQAGDETTFEGVPTIKKEVTFIQNNNSPKALSNAEIYRQTKNQLSVVKGGLDD